MIWYGSIISLTITCLCFSGERISLFIKAAINTRSVCRRIPRRCLVRCMHQRCLRSKQRSALSSAKEAPSRLLHLLLPCGILSALQISKSLAASLPLQPARRWRCPSSPPPSIPSASVFITILTLGRFVVSSFLPGIDDGRPLRGDGGPVARGAQSSVRH